jgi:hypothetical protein
MDPVIISSIITAAASIGTSIFEGWSKSTKKEDEKLDKIITENYEKLRSHITDPCTRILKRSEDRQNHVLSDLRDAAYPEIKFSAYTDEKQYNEQFKYRLNYLQLVGVMFQAGGDYFITPLGMAFMREARNRKDYFDVLFR